MPSSFLLRALIASLFLHAILFWPRNADIPSGHAATVLAATLRSMRGAQELQQSALVNAPAVVSHSPVRAIVTPAKETLLPSAVTSSAQASAGQLSMSTAIPAISPSMAVTNDGSLDADGMRRYRLNLALAAQAAGDLKQRLLTAARGQVLRLNVRVTIAQNGSMTGVEVLEPGSGVAAFDHAALTAFTSAAVATPVPGSLSGRTFSLVLPVEVSP